MTPLPGKLKQHREASCKSKSSDRQKTQSLRVSNNNSASGSSDALHPMRSGTDPRTLQDPQRHQQTNLPKVFHSYLHVQKYLGNTFTMYNYIIYKYICIYEPVSSLYTFIYKTISRKIHRVGRLKQWLGVSTKPNMRITGIQRPGTKCRAAPHGGRGRAARGAGRGAGREVLRLYNVILKVLGLQLLHVEAERCNRRCSPRPRALQAVQHFSRRGSITTT